MDLHSIHNADVAGKRILVRADLNVPLDNGRITDATRIERFAAGMRPLLERGARLTILTHLGRPQDRNPAYSVAPLRPALSRALGVAVKFSGDCADPAAVRLSQSLRDGEALLCENLRYNAGETANDPDFAAALARLGDLYVNDAFSCAHRAHASTEAIARRLPAYAGPLLSEEIAALGAALEAPEPPAVAIVGGAKVSTKIAVLKNLVTRLDHVIIGGGMANTFLFAQGAPMGRSLHEADQTGTVAEITALARQSGCTLHLPADVVVATEFSAEAPHRVVAATDCPADAMILEI
ncbi:MAG: phosphoglycerate kinase, partial [Pseudodonghicola sp.]